VAGIVYEDGTLMKSGGHPRIQLANGNKVRHLRTGDELVPATPEAIEKFQAEAIEGMTPDEIIARETAENEEHDHGDQGEEGEEEED